MFYEACYLRTVRVRLRLDEVLISVGLCNCKPNKEIVSKYFEIDLLLMSAHANVRDGNIHQGKCEYDKALELLERLESCKECGGK